jgi:pimeloyl-ACP methyl ester carboxylesterase
VVDALAADYTVVLPDLPGSGDSALPPGSLTMGVVADQVVAAARLAGLDEFVVAGASLGASVAIKAAASHPDRISGLATVVGYAYPRTTLRLNLELWAAMNARGDGDVGKLLTSLSFSEQYLAVLPGEVVAQVIEQFGGSPAPGAAEQLAFTLDVDVREELGAVHVPTLVVAAGNDRFVAPEHSAEIAEAINTARLVTVPGGHASIVESPQETLEPLQEFLKEVW